MLIQLADAHIPSSLSGPVLVDRHGLPRYWTVVWSAAVAGALADSTHIKKLRYIENLYQHADELCGHGSLDDALGTLNDCRLADMLESWFISIRNQAVTTEADETRWQVGFGFVTSIVSWIAKSDTHRTLRLIESRLHQLAVLYSQFRVKKRNTPEMLRSLPASTVEVLYQILDPESKDNPFPRVQTRWRVYVAFILMLHQGLRRGEVLLLPADAIKSAFDAKLGRDRCWINVRENDYESAAQDPRYSKPSIKTKNSIRQIPTSETTARIIESYASNYRGRPQHSFLLNSKSNLPLSTEALTKAFSVISSRLPAQVVRELESRTGKTTVTPHDLRHTCSVVRLHQLLQHGDSMDEALQKMRTFFGWSRQSTMPSRYARAVFEDRLAGIWNNAFDDRVALLRAIPKEY
ncbi:MULTISPECIES: site-specific integrase [unclassified Janthinobacterium]|uniref:site-specific integrase n=1 Tax=unclassified Janthinobacterium TaxID=2610881 RepID=UPI0016164973|nr:MULTISPECIES: site-specific integrase [unclassified Janthinobacterium]MBB5371312.1 integrase [Janthinobacterium sp. K2C7]MBB5384118.1 integrase [Janthinobacterium sp. K2Li3]MBB5389422.1 integrase [Janthinobacterium sp. K2E3]